MLSARLLQLIAQSRCGTMAQVGVLCATTPYSRFRCIHHHREGSPMRRPLALSMILLLAAALLPSLSRAWSDGASADLVLGQANFTSNATATTQSGMNFPL